MDNAERVEQGLFCVYCLQNKINGKKYIGQTFNIENRWKDKEESYKGCTALEVQDFLVKMMKVGLNYVYKVVLKF